MVTLPYAGAAREEAKGRIRQGCGKDRRQAIQGRIIGQRLSSCISAPPSGSGVARRA